MATAVVVDTMIATLGSVCGPPSARQGGRPYLNGSAWVLPFTVVAEMRSCAEVARWGARRRGVLDHLISRAGVVPPLDAVTDAYVDLRTWTVRTGHGLGAKDHEADRWVAAVAMAAKLPLATEDSIFDGVVGLLRATPQDQ